MTSGTSLPDAAVRVLLIEDNPDDAGLVRAMLSESHGAEFRVEWAKALAPGMILLGAARQTWFSWTSRSPTVKGWRA